jgi:hypothetical protein
MIRCATHAEEASTAICTRCERPLCDTCSQTFAGKTYCATCAADLERRNEERHRNPADLAGSFTGVLPSQGPIGPAAGVPYGSALLFAVLGGALGALIWFAVVAVTNYKLGIIAILVGWLVGEGAVIGSQRRGGHAVALLAVVVALVAMAAGEYLRINHLVADLLAKEEMAAPAGFISLSTFGRIYGRVFSPMDLVFYAIGAHQAWRRPAATPA